MLLLVVAVVWGSSYLTAKNLTLAAGVIGLLALRYAISAAVMLPSLAFRRPTRRTVRVGVLLGLTQASVLVLETYGVSMTSASNAGVLISLTILITAALDRQPGRFLLAAGVAVAGVILLVAGPGLRAPSLGDGLMLAAAVVRSVHVLLSARLTRGLDPVPLTTIQLLVGTVLFAPGLVPAARAYGPAEWGGVLYLALGCSVFAFLAQLWALQRTSAGRASLLLGTEPVWAVVIGVLIGGETLGWATTAGIALVLIGTYWGRKLSVEPTPDPSPEPFGGDRDQPHATHHPGQLPQHSPDAVTAVDGAVPAPGVAVAPASGAVGVTPTAVGAMGVTPTTVGAVGVTPTAVGTMGTTPTAVVRTRQ
ncbi:DMT family transporter [Actinoplanes rectilineatus]|uniref:DMT family transporter n=1 Tax=Actinoplanes rectilineatus TaxID=113571 RepID=UPI0007C75AFD|nr:DMT family transporter [Actinoplanes rectilineatus]